MTSLRVALHRWTVVSIVAWSLVLLVIETFKGGSVGNPILCATDPTCGEVAWIPTAAWICGTLVILVIGYGSRPAGGPATAMKDKVIGLVIALGILVLAGVALTLYQETRAIA